MVSLQGESDRGNHQCRSSDTSAMDVAKELGGLLLALITVGRAMHDSTDPSEWELAIERLEQSNLHEVKFAIKDESVFQTLRFSYDSLRNETLKECFLHCSLWHENYAINKDKLIQLWMGLGLFDKLKNEINVTIQKEKNEITNGYLIGYNCIRRIQALCLLEAIDGDREVRMHNLNRDMALWIVNKQGVERYKSIIPYGAHKKDLMIEISSDTEIISLMHAQTKIPLSSPCSSTRLSTVLLNNNQLCDSKPLELALFSKLTFLDLSSNNFEVFPDEICKLVHLLFLNLSWNPKLPKDLMALINLKYLLLRGIEYCNIPNGVLSKLKTLKVLDLHYSYHGRGTEGNLRTFSSLEEELRCLLHFQALGITISSMHDYQKLSQMTTVPIRSLDIKNFEVGYSRLSVSGNLLGNPQLQNNLVSIELSGMSVEWIKFEIRNCDQSICHLEKLEKLFFNWMKVVWMGLDPKDVFFRLQCLHFVYCDQLTSISWVVCLLCIRELNVWLCRNVKQLICTDELNNAGLSACQPSFPFLKEMTLCINVELEYISDPKITYPALEILLVYTCNKLKKLPFKTENPPRNLRFWGTEEWWNNIEMDDVTHRSSLQSFFNKTFYD